MRDLRDWLTYLHSKNLVATTKTGLDPRFEVMRVYEAIEGSKACFFPDPKGCPMPIAAGTVARREWIAQALGLPDDEVLKRIQYALKNPLPWKVVDQAAAPVHEVVVEKDIDLLRMLPVVTHHEKDAGPYITFGLVHGANPHTGKQNVSINRMQVQGPDKLTILMLPRDLYAYYAAAEAMNRPLPVTITIGHDPITELSSQAIAPRDVCELEIAGALKGEPVEVVKSYTNDVYIPAHAEIAIEGEIVPHLRVLEGPFGEFPKYYTGQGLLPYIQVKCITHRRNPIYKFANPSGAESLILGAVPREASILERLQLNFPNVLNVRLPAGGRGRFHLVVKVKKRQVGEGKNIIAAAFGCHYDIKQVIVVDEDIDIDSPEEVEWAVATRFQADRDLVVLHRSLGSKLDPTASRRGLSSKLGMDATAYVDEEERFYVARVPGRPLGSPDEVMGDAEVLTPYLKAGKA